MDTPLRHLEYVVVDLETTGGPHQHGHRVTEVAAVVVSGAGLVVEEWSTLVDPGRPISPFVTRLTSITNAMVAGAPRFADIAPRVRELLRGRVFVAHNAGFDWHFLRAELAAAETLARELPDIPQRAAGQSAYEAAANALRAAGYGLTRNGSAHGARIVMDARTRSSDPDPHSDPVDPDPDPDPHPAERILCTVKLSKRLVPELSRRSLDALQEYFGIENAARHRAWGDARATAQLLGRLLARLEEREVGTWRELQELLRRRRRRRRRRRALPAPAEDA